jgi:phospholipid-binding lipoprotein MlaA
MRLIVTLSLLMLVTGCATPAANQGVDADPFDRQDPLKPMNQAVFAFNISADTHVIRPVAQTYHEAPVWARGAIGNFLSNLSEPANGINGVLQLKPEIALTAFWRFALNSTVGLGGLRDFAGENGLKNKDTDFGKTLGRYGVGDGPYLVLPLAGPSTAPDTAGLAVDWVLDPVGWVLTVPESVAQTVSEGVVTRDGDAAIIDQLYYDSLEPYTATRAAYLQHQAFQ